MCFVARFSCDALDPESAVRIANAYPEPSDSPRVALRADGPDLRVRTEKGCACALFPNDTGFQPEDLTRHAAPQLADLIEYMARSLETTFRFRSTWDDGQPPQTLELGVRAMTDSIRRGKLSSTTEFVVVPD